MMECNGEHPWYCDKCDMTGKMLTQKLWGKHISSLKVSNAEEPGALNICLRPHKDNTWVEIYS